MLNTYTAWKTSMCLLVSCDSYSGFCSYIWCVPLTAKKNETLKHFVKNPSIVLKEVSHVFFVDHFLVFLFVDFLCFKIFTLYCILNLWPTKTNNRKHQHFSHFSFWVLSQHSGLCQRNSDSAHFGPQNVGNFQDSDSKHSNKSPGPFPPPWNPSKVCFLRAGKNPDTMAFQCIKNDPAQKMCNSPIFSKPQPHDTGKVGQEKTIPACQ